MTPQRAPQALHQFCPSASHNTATKPLLRCDETGLKPRCARMISIKRWGAIMLEIIINLFYRQSCKTALCAIRRQHHIWV
jgi:hypothetical protein